MQASRNTSAQSDGTVTVSVLQKVAEKRIYFGHQSVGLNIIDGIHDIEKDHQGVALKIVKTTDPLALNSPVFAHSMVGENEDPISKINEFVRSMDSGLGEKAEIAFLKFCYVDITRNTDVEKVFAAYKSAMQRLKETYPHTQFVHLTAPLSLSLPSLKGWIKGMLGREDNNVKKSAFNAMLRREYGGSNLLFDVAAIESTYPDGRKATFTSNGTTYDSLVPEYTNDDGHLNETGRRIMAGHLLKFLSKL
ncbi:MAG: hypothetical protein IPM58_09070 [Nitrospira sp.]|nr:hypothetical protein [Nitrospira sp.]